MNHIISKRLVIAAIALLTVPGTLLAQTTEKEKAEKEKSEKKDIQNITIVRTGDKDEKCVIEIQGEKVLINGKEAKDNKDVSVRVNTYNTRVGARTRVAQGGGYTEFDTYPSLFDEDENRAMLGVTTDGVEKGAKILTINKESGAEKAGLKKGDIITKIDDKKIEESGDVSNAIKAKKPKDKVTITFLRDGKEEKVTAELGKWKGMTSTIAPNIDWHTTTPVMPTQPFNGTIYNTGRPKLGLSIQDTDDGVGVKVLEVDEDSNAGKAGIKEGDVIVGVDDHEIRSTDEVTKIMRTAPKDKYTFRFRVQRDGKTQNIEVKLPRKLKTADL
jgi:serine protease Do